MEERKIRERHSQDARFSKDRGYRGAAEWFYWITTASYSRFQNRLTQDAPGKRILEIGSGAGGNVVRLCAHGAYATGIDLSPAAVDLATNSVPETIKSRATFMTMDAEHMDFAGSTFDIVVGNGILHHLSLERAYSEISRVLKPSGYALFSEPLAYNPFINLYRRVTPRQRTPDEHPLRLDDLELARRYFGRVDVQYYYLMTLCALPLGPNALGRFAVKGMNALDRVLFRMVRPLRRFAWFALIELSEPCVYGSSSSYGCQARIVPPESPT